MHNCQTVQRFSRAVLALALAVCGAAMPVSSPPRRLHTVSGVSSGGDMAMIHAVAYSESILGVAVVAGAPYGCNAIVHPGREVPLCHTAPRHFSSLPVASIYALASLAVMSSSKKLNLNFLSPTHIFSSQFNPPSCSMLAERQSQAMVQGIPQTMLSSKST